MALPRKPERSAPIPNQPFESPEVTTVRGPYWDMPLGPGLETDGQGSVQTTGSTPSEPSAYLYGSNGFIGVGTGLQLGPNGEFETSSAYIYCTPQYGNLPVSYPPYDCETAVNTAGVTDFTYAWFNCQYLTEFPCVDSSSVTDFSYAWSLCEMLTTFPNLDTGSGVNFTQTWSYTGLTSFPRLDVSHGSIFYYTWAGCYYMTSFPQLNVSEGEIFNYAWAFNYSLVEFPNLDVSLGSSFFNSWASCYSLETFPPLQCSSGVNFGGAWGNCSGLTSFPGSLDLGSGTNFSGAWAGCTSLTSFPGTLNLSSGTNFAGTWYGCTSLTSFPAGMFDSCSATNNFAYAWQNCALSQQSVDNILVSLNTAGQSNGQVNLDGGTSAAPGPTGLAAKAALQARGWTVLTN